MYDYAIGERVDVMLCNLSDNEISYIVKNKIIELYMNGLLICECIIEI